MKRERQVISAGTREETTVTAAGRRLAATTEAGLKVEVALYIEQMAAELSIMARAADLPSLARFLDMAHFEAEAIGDALESRRV